MDSYNIFQIDHHHLHRHELQKKNRKILNIFFFCSLFRCLVNGLGAPSVIPPFALGLGTPLTTGAYGSAIPSLGAFALATTTGIGQTNPQSIRGISNVLLVSNLNEEVSQSKNKFQPIYHSSKLLVKQNKIIYIFSMKYSC